MYWVVYPFLVTVAVRFGVLIEYSNPFLQEILPRVEQKQRNRSIRHTYPKDCGDMNVIGQQGLRLASGASRSDCSNRTR